jgi:hypothetical protein
MKHLVINLHFNDLSFVNLGLVRVYVNSDAVSILELLRKKLEEFSLNIRSHIVGFVADGARTNLKIGKLVGIDVVQCSLHSLNLAVNRSISKYD